MEAIVVDALVFRSPILLIHPFLVHHLTILPLLNLGSKCALHRARDPQIHYSMVNEVMPSVMMSMTQYFSSKSSTPMVSRYAN